MLWRLLSLFQVAEEEAVVTDDLGGEGPGNRHIRGRPAVLLGVATCVHRQSFHFDTEDTGPLNTTTAESLIFVGCA